MQDMKTDQASVEVLVAPILAISLCRLLHFVIEIRYRTVAVLCQGREKREDSKPLAEMRGHSGFRFCIAHMRRYNRFSKHSWLLFSSMSNRFSFPRVGGRGVSKDVGNRDRCAHYCVAHFG